ncbi:MAG TPA: hypothetical protein PK911_05140 [Candidatus Saccharibacteria bacterium]|nr:hypothetical protein [Candidatus Saccharibacteria bacterium]
MPVYDFKIHATIRERSAIGQVEANDIVEATADAMTAYKAAHPGSEIIHITIEDAKAMQARRKQWEDEQ